MAKTCPRGHGVMRVLDNKLFCPMCNLTLDNNVNPDKEEIRQAKKDKPKNIEKDSLEEADIKENGN